MSRFQYSTAQQECFYKWLEKENAMKIVQNKKMNDQLMEIRKQVIKSTC